jgi:peptidoglycan/LPS O-acetylase OafA/YrhL
MPIFINNPVLSTNIFIAILTFGLILTIRRKKDQELFPLILTQELKGLAILAVIFSHVGYFLAVDHRFLFPLSIMAGVGVNLFLFLSGFGLTTSALKKKLPIGKFYLKRFWKLFKPFWLVILIFFLLDYFLLHITYDWPYIIRSILGIFPRGDLLLDINSPFWFFTPLLFYYFIFPLIFFQKRPWLTAVLLYSFSYALIQLNLPVSSDILRLYQLHILAFPLGIAFAALFFEPFCLDDFTPGKLRAFLYNLEKPAWIKIILDKFKSPNILKRYLKILNRPAYLAIMAALLALIGFTAYYSNVGSCKEQLTSLITMSAIILFFIMKKFELRLLYLFGVYSYEIYLVHWPLMSRYDFLFKKLPGWLAMLAYLGFFIILAHILKKTFSQKTGSQLFAKFKFDLSIGQK